MAPTDHQVDALSEFIVASPTPWHAARNAATMLTAAGFVELSPSGGWDEPVARGLVVRDGSLIAWNGAPGVDEAPVRMIGAHTDSPGLRIRPRPDLARSNARQVAVEVYGSPLLNSWLDRDLTVAGRAVMRDAASPGGVATRLFHHLDPLMRVAQLAIHLDREANEGLTLDRQRHLAPIWGLEPCAEQAPANRSLHPGTDPQGEFRGFLAELLGVHPDDVMSWDAQLADCQAPSRIGRDGELLAAPRLDDLCCCFGAVRALAATPVDGPPTVVVLNDHEEVGSTSATGAVGGWLRQVLERIAVSNGGSHHTLLGSLSGWMLLSADMAHATHPNYQERHEPSHPVRLGGGPVIKHNVNARYATDSITAAAFVLACERAGVAYQEYSHRGDIPCGSTIGPITAAALSVDTVDVGIAQLSMHSAREVMACADVGHLVDAFGSWLQG